MPQNENKHAYAKKNQQQQQLSAFKHMSHRENLCRWSVRVPCISCDVLSYRNPIAEVLFPRSNANITFYVYSQTNSGIAFAVCVCMSIQILFCWIGMRIDRQNDTTTQQIENEDCRRIREKGIFFRNVYIRIPHQWLGQRHKRSRQSDNTKMLHGKMTEPSVKNEEEREGKKSSSTAKYLHIWFPFWVYFIHTTSQSLCR